MSLLKSRAGATNLWTIIVMIITISLGVVVTGMTIQTIISARLVTGVWNTTLTQIASISSSMFQLMPIIVLVAIISFIVAWFGR